MALDPAILMQLLGRHPARRMTYEALRAGLMEAVGRKDVNVCREGDLELFGYSRQCQFEQQWNLFSLIARGLILDSARQRIVATPFPKFFNFGEGGVALPREAFEVSEKLDGSLGIVFHHEGRWRVSTRGQLGSPQGAWATEHLHARADVKALVPGTTYLVEIIYSANQIVIPYDFDGLVLLGAYDELGDELPRAELERTAVAGGLRIARSMAYGSFDELLNVAGRLTRYEEGFVIRFASGLRVKVKGEAYCRIHKLVIGCTPLAIWESMMNDEDLDSVRGELPEEMRRDFDAIRRLLGMRFDALLAEIRAGYEMMRSCSDKELGLLIQGESGQLTAGQRKFAFASRRPEFFDAIQRKGEWREKMFKFMRPDRNRLEGYLPSDAITRFAEEAG